jgi:hypothetical protein
MFSNIIPIIFIPFALSQKIFNREFEDIFPKYIETTDFSKYICKLLFICLGVKNKFLKLDTNNLNLNNKFIDKGFILANHRSTTDLWFDTLISESSSIGRHLATLSVLFYGLLVIIENKYISINRNKSREIIFKIIINHMKNINYKYNNRMLFWPEGTRRKHNFIKDIAESKSLLKPGLLKSIYEYKEYPVQIFITKNKEKVLDEKKLYANYGVELISTLSTAINPKDYEKFDDFYNKISEIWFYQFNFTML